MEKSLATTAAFGIGHARTQPMKNLYSDLQPEHEALGNAFTRAAERSKKIRIVFEDDVSTCGVKIVIKNSYVPAKIFMPELQNHIEHASLHPRPRHES